MRLERLTLPLQLHVTSETLLFWSLIKRFHFVSASCFFRPSPDWGPITSIWRNVNLTWALSIGEVFTKYSDKLCYPRVLGLKSLWTQFLSYWMPIAALRWLTSLGWWEMRRDSSLKKFGDKDKESTFPEGNRAAWRCEGVHGNPDNKKIPTDHFPVHNTLQKPDGKTPACREECWDALSHFLPPPPHNPNRLPRVTCGSETCVSNRMFTP